MFQPVMRSVVALVVAVVLFGTIPLAHAQASYPVREQPLEPSAEAIVADVMVLRPVGLVATVFGTLIYVISLPVSLPTGSAGYVAEKLVVAPAKYTFVRPLGVPQPGTDPDLAR
jgi:hypothetical protein